MLTYLDSLIEFFTDKRKGARLVIDWSCSLSLLPSPLSPLIALSSPLIAQNLTFQVRGYIRDMDPAVVILCDELGEAYLPLPLHLLYHAEQSAVVIPVPGYQVGSTAEEVVAVLGTSDERVELLAAVARGHYDGLSPRLADGVEELVYEYVE